MTDEGPGYAVRLRETVKAAVPRLRALGEEGSRARRVPEAWSPREIVGHLIDSASNNHGRFVRASLQDSLVFPGYDQEGWVTAQRYADAPWDELVTLWASFNRHLARVMESIPMDVRMRPRSDHALDRIAWRTVPADEPATLDYFMDDYVGHLEHHLAQIFGEAG